MKILLSLCVFLCTAVSVYAYNPILVEPPQPYEVVLIEGDPYIQREYLGDLEDFPDMYEVTSEVTFDLKVQLRQRAVREPKSFALIIVRQNDSDGGVSEISRLNQPTSEWVKMSAPSLGMTFLESTRVEKELPPGTYRIEVSTPDNNGEYMLVIGDEPTRSGFFKAIGQIYTTQAHFRFTPFRMLFSSYIFYPVGIILVAYGIYRTWKYRKKLLRR